MDFSKQEEKILKFWKRIRAFEKSIEQRKDAPNFVFYEGPPTANGRPGIHHVLARAFKDIICRYKTMAGFRVSRRAGWDTHGLPVEIEIEKELHTKNKKDIERYGIARFNERCKQSVWRYKGEWERLTQRIGFWLDLKNPYITYENDYIESLWWIIKQIYKKGLLYQDYKVVPYCPRGGTALSSHEVAQGYKKITEPAIYIKLKVKSLKVKSLKVKSLKVESRKLKVGSETYNLKPNTYLLVWTTTPWTLPANVVVAVNPKFSYVQVKQGKEHLILAEERLEILEGEYKIARRFQGKELVGLEYEPLYPNPGEHRVSVADFVTQEEGTGIVHVAPAYGIDDMRLSQKEDLSIVHTVDLEGKFKLSHEFQKQEPELFDRINNKFVKQGDKFVIENLKDRGLLFKQEAHEHDYPFCWRCGSPLLYYAKQSWFIKMQELRQKLLDNNQQINWIPSYLKEGRFGQWLKDVKDWALSRERYWATPLPVWVCGNCHHQIVLGSKQELSKQRFTTNKYFILRHGQSLRNTRHIVSCWPEKVPCPLTDKGKQQAAEAAQQLKEKDIDLIFSSDLLRTRQTAEIVGKVLGRQIHYEKRLREIDLGIFNGKPISEAGAAWGDYLGRFENRVYKGETYTEVKKRMYEFLREIDKKYTNKNILIISHECPLSLLEGAVRGYSRKEIIGWRANSLIAVGEVRQLIFRFWPYNREGELDFHRPFIDEVEFLCPRCGAKMKRVEQVIDCWFDSGAMPFAQFHFPFENKELIEKGKQFPAHYICEAIDQTRGWFYTLLAVSTLLGWGHPYKNVVSLGHVLDEKGKKMSKSKGNVVDPFEMMARYGSDAIRWYFFTINQPAEPKYFSEKDLRKILNKFIMTLWNCYVFYDTYTEKYGGKRGIMLRLPRVASSLGQRKSAILDRWIISKLNKLISEVTVWLEKYDVTSAARAIEQYVVEDLSLWYIRRSRRRFQKPRTPKELEKAASVLGFVLLNLSKLSAPFVPFISEEIYQGLRSKLRKDDLPQSIHWTPWPNSDAELVNQDLNQKMELVRKIVGLGLRARSRAGLRVRQPLSSYKIQAVMKQSPEAEPPSKLNKELLDLIKEELNVKETKIVKEIKPEKDWVVEEEGGFKISLNTHLSTILREEGIINEVVRYVQQMRKAGGFKPKDRIVIQCSAVQKMDDLLRKNKDTILRETKAEDFLSKPKGEKTFDVEREVKIDHYNLWLAIRVKRLRD